MVLFRMTWACNCTSLCCSQPSFESCGINSELAGVGWINIQSMKLLEITLTSALYKVLSIIVHKDVFISSRTTSWKQSLTDCFHKKISSRGNTLPELTDMKAYSHCQPGTEPRCSSDLRHVPAAGCLDSCQSRTQRCKLQQCVFEVRSNITGEVLRF